MMTWVLALLLLWTSCALAQDHYKVLGVPPNASQSEIDRTYRAWLSDPAGVPDAVRAAYEVLSDATRRDAYDQETIIFKARERRAEASLNVESELAADYRLNDPIPATVRKGFLRMMKDERKAAEKRVVGNRNRENEALREIYFFNNYDALDPRFVAVLNFARAQADKFFDAKPTKAEALEFLEAVDVGRRVSGFVDQEHAIRFENASEQETKVLRIRTRAYVLDNSEALSASEFVDALSEWLNEARLQPLDPGELRRKLEGWVQVAKKRYGKDLPSLWEALEKMRLADGHSYWGVELPWMVEVFQGLVPGKELLASIERNLVAESGKQTRSQILERAQLFAPTLNKMSEAEPEVRQALANYRSKMVALSSTMSATARCRWALGAATAR